MDSSNPREPGATPRSKPLGPSGPTQAELDQLKGQAGDIFHMTHAKGTPQEQVFICRMLKYVEEQDMRKRQRMANMAVPPQDFDPDQFVLDKCLLWPKFDRASLMSLGAGIPSTIVNYVMGESGYDHWEEPVRL